MAKRKKSDISSIFTAPTPTPAAQQATSAPVANDDKPARKSSPRPDREGKRGNLVFINEAAEKSFSIMGIELDKTKQALMVEAINDLFVKYGRDPIA
jgi:hypothetical protein